MFANSVTHDLKTWPVYFEAVSAGDKLFELRFNDRNFRRGDTLRLREYLPETGVYTGREEKFLVRYVLSDFVGLAPGWVAMSIERIDEPPF